MMAERDIGISEFGQMKSQNETIKMGQSLFWTNQLNRIFLNRKNKREREKN